VVTDNAANAICWLKIMRYQCTEKSSTLNKVACARVKEVIDEKNVTSEDVAKITKLLNLDAHDKELIVSYVQLEKLEALASESWICYGDVTSLAYIGVLFFLSIYDYGDIFASSFLLIVMLFWFVLAGFDSIAETKIKFTTNRLAKQRLNNDSIKRTILKEAKKAQQVNQ
jgi:hypothetical protein